MQDSLAALIAQYRSGLEAEIALLDRLHAVAARQVEASQASDLTGFMAASDERDSTMSALVTIEHELKPIRSELARYAQSVQRAPEFDHLNALHREAATRVRTILAGDEQAVIALSEAERARRTAAQTLEQGESTLAGYRRVVAPGPGQAALLNKRG